MAARKAKEAGEFCLGDGVLAAHAIERTKKDLNREFRNSPLKGVKHQTSVIRKQQKAQRASDRHRNSVQNPKIKGLHDVPGLVLDEDGTIGLEELKRQRPDFIHIKEVPSPAMEAKHLEILARGKRDYSYERFFGKSD